MHSLIELRQWITSMIDFSTELESSLGELRTTSFTNYKCSNTFGFVSVLFNLEVVNLLVREHTGKHGFDDL